MRPKELTLRGLILGVLITTVFTAANVYLGLKVGLTFASALRAILRQDPDVMLVGEIRDHDTADIATHAALTGHLVLSTLHTNDAATALIRLIDLGVEKYLVASTVEAVLAQRLVRRICRACASPQELTGEERLGLGIEEGEVIPSEITIHIENKVHKVPYKKGQTILEAARAAGLNPLSSCEEGFCASCAAKTIKGKVVLAKNDIYTTDDLANNWILTCQGHCFGEEVEITYDVV